MRRKREVKARVDLAAAALCIEWGWREAKRGKRPKWYVGCWLGGFEWPIFVGVDGFAYGKTVFGGTFEEAISRQACRYLVVRLRKRCGGVRAGYLVVRLAKRCGGVRCVALSVYCHAASAPKRKQRRIVVLRTALDLAPASVQAEKEAKWYVGSWLAGFEWPIFVEVDGFAYGKTGS
ncbi:hypothetical protein EAH_00062250 [Eimeria acervulina]|uniref:Uncharacterized protein n=1 Tax=Eimeria acervulina TaxID=5801 RepID=U6GPY5_EIMAC|nr:hypothetical protein EAH_00062250 [Eimeria acervulina]CDI81617.1 hypothetical protein EAH_00062250 [Eimeria acervulina]